MKDARFVRKDCPPFLQKNAFCQAVVNEDIIGVVGEVGPEVLAAYDLERPVFFFDLNVDLLAKHFSTERVYRPLPKYPAVARDLALVVDADFEYGDILETIQSLQMRYVEDVQIFDIYKGEQIGSGKKGLTLRITYRSADGTLEDTQVNELHEEIASRLSERLRVELRT
jgi:phenylalanyl-tRNA synthetase beta chain